MQIDLGLGFKKPTMFGATSLKFSQSPSWKSWDQMGGNTTCVRHFEVRLGPMGALDFIYTLQGALQPVKLTRHLHETQRPGLWGFPGACGWPLLQDLSC